MWRQLFAWSLLVSISFAETPTQNAEQADFLKRQHVWKEQLRTFPARFSNNQQNYAFESLKRYRGNLQVHLVYDPNKRRVFEKGNGSWYEWHSVKRK